MKKTFTLFLMVFVLLTAKTFADNMTYTWSFATNLTGAASNSQTVPDASTGAFYAGTSFGNTLGTVTGWARLATTSYLPYTAYNATGYVQFEVSPPASTKLTVSSVAGNFLGGGTGGAYIAAYYSFDNFATAGVNLGTATYNGTSGKTTTTSAGLNLLNSGSATATLQGLTQFSPSILVGAGRTLYIRIYGWAGSSNRYLAIKNFVVSGTTEAVQNTVNLTTSVSPSGAGTVTPASGTVESGSTVTLTATKAFGYAFKEWRGAKSNTFISSANPCNITPTTDTAVVAVFDPVPTYSFTLNKAGSGANWGQITVSPSASNGKYEAGTSVSLSVIPNAVSTFSYWENQSTTSARTVVVTKDTTLTATFDLIPFIVGWDFKNASPNSARPGDFYAGTSNKGIFNLYNQDGSVASWLAHAGAHSPATPCAYKWNSDFATNQRYYQASFSTTGYQNVQIKSQMAADYQYYPTQKLQASLDGTTYTDLKYVNISNTWTDLNYILPSGYDDQATVYVRWVADVTSTATGTGNDGTSITNVFIYADSIPVNDNTAPNLVSTVPANNASAITANGSIILTFNEAIKAGTGDCTLNGTKLIPTYGSKTVSFAYTKLTYNTDYSFVIPAGAITDKSGNAFAGVTLNLHTMNRPIPTPKLFNAVVAKDGSGDYSTIQAAIDAVPTGQTQSWLIFVKNGTYNGHVDIPSSKPYVNLIGQNRDSVIISDARLSGASSAYPDSVVYSVDPGATVVVKAANCYFENICFENKFGYANLSGPQALALYTTNDRVVLNNCWLRSYQDTYLTTYGNVAYRHYLKNCRIEGAVDFIYGGGDVFFDKCLIYCTRSAGGYIVAPSHLTGTKWGYVFSDCTIDGPSASYTTYLGRPWTNSPMASFFNTTCKIGIYPAGWWHAMGAIPAIFADYNSMDGNGSPLDLSQRISLYDYVSNGTTITGTAKKSFTDAEAATYTYENVTSGTDGWDPRTVTEPTNAPANVTITSGGNLTWVATQYAICYVVIRNNKVIGFTTGTSYTDASYTAGASYKLVAVAESGALSPSTVALNGVSTEVNSHNMNNAYAYTTDRTLVVKNVTLGSQVSMYGIKGDLLARKLATSSVVTFECVSPCVLKIANGNSRSVIKVVK